MEIKIIEEDKKHLRDVALLAAKCPSSDTAFSVGALIVSSSLNQEFSGYSRETGPTDHAEQASLIKLISYLISNNDLFKQQLKNNKIELPISSSNLNSILDLDIIDLPLDLICYTSMEPCGTRSSQKYCCAELLIKSKMSKIVYQMKEPTTFVKNPIGYQLIIDSGIPLIHIPDID